METIADVIKRLELEYGIKRLRYNADPVVAKRIFISFANAVLQSKNAHFDAEAVNNTIDVIIDWLYLSGDKLDFNKGLLLKGKTGVGKTFLMAIMAEMMKLDNMMYVSGGKRISLTPVEVNARAIASEYSDAESPYAVITKYGKMHSLIINDIGAEMAVSVNFGNRENVIERIIDMREESRLITFGTTNINKMSEKYDSRTISRMYALFNVVNMTNSKDFRTNKSV